MKSPLSVLLVDDDEMTLTFNTIILKRLGIDISILKASCGHQALEIIQSRAFSEKDSCGLPDFILLDLNMPGMGGWEFLDQLAELNLPDLDQIKIAILTTSSNPDDALQAKQNPLVHSFLTKPLKPDDLRVFLEEESKSA